MQAQLKRIYEEANPSDGYRVLVDRLWPRGISKERAALDEWLRDIAPSTELRHWFAHDHERWSEFKQRYRSELQLEPAAAAWAHLRELAAQRPITLLYSAKDEQYNHAIALLEMLGIKMQRD